MRTVTTTHMVAVALGIVIGIMLSAVIADIYYQQEDAATRRAEQLPPKPIDQPLSYMEIDDGIYKLQISCAKMTCKLGFVVLQECWVSSTNPVVRQQQYFESWPYPPLKRQCVLD